MSESRTLKVRLVRSPIGFSKRQKDTVRSLGFTRLQQLKALPDNDAVRGMIAAVSHLVQLEEDAAGQKGGAA
jgi:large subunit ribosomal protein L30